MQEKKKGSVKRASTGEPTKAAAAEPKKENDADKKGPVDTGDVLREVAGELVTNSIAKMGVEYAIGRRDSIELHIKEGLQKFLGAMNLKYYFSIDENYVYRKCRLILCPIIYKGSWKRR